MVKYNFLVFKILYVVYFIVNILVWELCLLILLGMNNIIVCICVIKCDWLLYIYRNFFREYFGVVFCLMMILDDDIIISGFDDIMIVVFLVMSGKWIDVLKGYMKVVMVLKLNSNVDFLVLGKLWKL